MQPLVLQLQAECLDTNTSALDVLRKALVVARKLSLTDAQVWIEKELNGYKAGDQAPPHRLIKGDIRAWNPYHRWIPIMFESAKEADFHATCYVGQPVGELEEMLRHGNGTLSFPFSPEVQQRFMDEMDLPLQPTRILNRAAIKGILDAVRHMVLDWSLELEKAGILGEGLVFSQREKDTAASANYTINYNGPVTNSPVQQGSPHATQSMTVTSADRQGIEEFIRVLEANTTKLGLDAAEAGKLRTEAQTVAAEIAKTTPSRDALRQSLRTIRNVLEGCGGSLAASGLLYEIAKLMN